MSCENGVVVEMDSDSVGVKGDSAAVVAEQANGQERSGSECRKNVGDGGGWRKQRVKVGGMRREDGVAVGKEDGDAGIGDLAVEVGR